MATNDGFTPLSTGLTGQQSIDAINRAHQGDNTKTFKVADAVNADEALTKGQLLTELTTIGGSGSGLDADLLDGLDWNDFRATTAILSGPSSVNENSITDYTITNYNADNKYIITTLNGTFSVTANIITYTATNITNAVDTTDTISITVISQGKLISNISNTVLNIIYIPSVADQAISNASYITNVSTSNGVTL